MIEKIEIKNYKGIEEISIDNFKKYNICVGDNSSCITSVMEAIYSSLPNVRDGIITTANSRGMQVRLDNIHNFFYNADIKKEIQFILDDKIITKINRKENNNVENEKIIKNIENNTISKNLMNMNVLNANMKYLYDILQKDKNNDKEHMDISVMIDNFIQILFQERINIKSGNYYGKSSWITPLSKYQNDTAKVVKKIIEKKKKNELLKIINILEPEIDDIISDGFEIQLSKNNAEKILSLSSFGNGLSSIVTTTSSLVNNETKILFIDEIEDGIHYLNYSKFCENLIKITEILDIQLFITTHSKEFLEAFYDKLSNNEVTLYRFQKSKNKIKKIYYPKEKVLYAIKEGWDIR